MNSTGWSSPILERFVEQNNGSDNKDDEGNNKTDYNDMNNSDDINNIWPSFSIIIIIREIKEKMRW